MHGLINPLTTEQLHEQLDDILGLVLAGRHSIASTVTALAPQTRAQQLWALEWVQQVAQYNTALAYHVAKQLPTALTLMPEAGIEQWLTACLDQYANTGLAAAIQQLQQVTTYAQHYQETIRGVTLADSRPVLQHFLTSLSGRCLELVSHESAIFTDTETLFLPATLHQFPNSADNFLLYQAMAVHLWAQTWFGTWRLSLTTAAQQFAEPGRVVALFHTLERLRLDACVARLLPGFERRLAQLMQQLAEPRVPPGWEAIATDLAKPGRQVQDSYAWLATVYEWEIPAPVCYQGELRPVAVEQVMNARFIREKHALQNHLANCQRRAAMQRSTDTDSSQPEFGLQMRTPQTAEAQSLPILTFDGVPMPSSPELQTVLLSIAQDHGTVPTEYFMGELPEAGKETQNIIERETPTTTPEEEVWLYPEWNYKTQRYQANWCWLREIMLPPGSAEFATETLQQYRGLLKKLQYTFEALRGGIRRERQQPAGDEFDLDALICAYADMQRGEELSPYVYSRWQRNARSVAVLFMVDMSGSTKGWINQAERESLVLLAEVLTLLGDQFAIYGFSGLTRRRCEIFPIKRFNEPYDHTVRQRISAIAPRDYTRMGVAVRHLSQILQQQPAATRLLITLSDGKPDDEGDNYRGRYGIEDTRQALLEARQLGIHPFCITIDSEARTYLPHLYGDVNYIVIEQVAQLPLKVADIYRKLTH